VAKRKAGAGWTEKSLLLPSALCVSACVPRHMGRPGPAVVREEQRDESHAAAAFVSRPLLVMHQLFRAAAGEDYHANDCRIPR